MDKVLFKKCYQTRVERLSRDKQYIIYGLFVSHKQKRF